jgi:hypothetical protein
MASKNNTGVGNIVINQDEGIAHNFDFFSGNTIEKSMARGFEQEIRPTTAITNEGPYEFFIPQSNDYIFLPMTRLYVKVRITTTLGANIPANTEFIVVNLLPHTLFKQIDVEVGGLNTTSQDQMYPYKAYLETLLTYPEGNGTHLSACSGYVLDTPELFDAPNNEAFDIRVTGLDTNMEKDYCIPLHCDILQSVKVLPGFTTLKFNLIRNNDAFSLMCNEDVDIKINIISLKLFIRKITPTESIRKMHLTGFEKNEAFLPFSRSVIKKHLINHGATNISLGGIFKGVLPRQILIAMVRSTRIDGRKTENPFKLEHYNVGYVNLRIDGQNCPPTPYQPHFPDGLISRELRALYDNIGVLTSASGCEISRNMFKNGYTLFAWDLTPDACNGWHIHEELGGRTVDLDLAFREPIPHPSNIIIYATYESGIKIGKDAVTAVNFVN